MSLWTELLVLQSIIGYCFVIANACIGIYNIRDLNNMKGDIIFVRAHKWIGRIESLFFLAISIQCMLMVIIPYGFGPFIDPYFYDLDSTFGWHNVFGGIISIMLFVSKWIIATFKKDVIYKYGQYIGPMGFIGWSLGHWTSLVFYYFTILPHSYGATYHIVPAEFFYGGFIPFPIGLVIFLSILYFRKTTGEGKSRFSVHQIAFILHGITFGYEKAAKDLLGAPAMFRYVVPKTYEFLEKMMGMMGLNLKELQSMNVNDAMDLFMKKAAQIRMAEKIKVTWNSESEFTVESINCSTSKVRSTMSKEELTNAVCPWAIMAATIVNKITGKDLEIDPSEFNAIGAVTRLRLKEE